MVEKLFLGTQAIDLDHGLTNSTPEIAQVRRGMIRAARQVILLMDSSKWGKARSSVERAGVELVVA